MPTSEGLIKEYNRLRLHEEAVNIERVHFYKTDKGVNPRQEDPLRYIQGNIPVLVSAPHAVRHFRQKKIKVSDVFTGSIVYLLNKLCGCHGLATIKLYGGDPNVDKNCIYKERIVEISKKEKIELILDIHGASGKHDFDVDLGTNIQNNLCGKNNILNTLENSFKEFGLKRISKDHFAASTPNTIANFVASELKIPAVQVEINKMYRSPNQNGQAFNRLMGALVYSLKKLGY